MRDLVKPGIPDDPVETGVWGDLVEPGEVRDPVEPGVQGSPIEPGEWGHSGRAWRSERFGRARSEGWSGRARSIGCPVQLGEGSDLLKSDNLVEPGNVRDLLEPDVWGGPVVPEEVRDLGKQKIGQNPACWSFWENEKIHWTQ